jgi:hypothetical protein
MLGSGPDARLTWGFALLDTPTGPLETFVDISPFAA